MKNEKHATSFVWEFQFDHVQQIQPTCKTRQDCIQCHKKWCYPAIKSFCTCKTANQTHVYAFCLPQILKRIDKFKINQINCVDESICNWFHSQVYYWTQGTWLLHIICKTAVVFAIKLISANGPCFSGRSLNMLIGSSFACERPLNWVSMDFHNNHSVHVFRVRCYLATIHFDVVACSFTSLHSRRIPISQIIFVWH